ncbi:MAG: hypothetical protein HW390_2374 [Candidatus Brocadiaceae bacterium]|nr:hypothetical protein [Candidatus Brocadiaceae bacterium]
MGKVCHGTQVCHDKMCHGTLLRICRRDQGIVNKGFCRTILNVQESQRCRTKRLLRHRRSGTSPYIEKAANMLKFILHAFRISP